MATFRVGVTVKRAKAPSDADVAVRIVTGTVDVLKWLGETIADILAIYPPVPYGSTYERTFHLQDGWMDKQTAVRVSTSKANNSTMSLRNESAVDERTGDNYWRFVEDKFFQTETHVGNQWKTAQDVKDTLLPTYRHKMEEALKNALTEVFV